MNAHNHFKKLRPSVEERRIGLRALRDLGFIQAPADDLGLDVAQQSDDDTEEEWP